MNLITLSDFSQALGPRMDSVAGLVTDEQVSNAIKTTAMELLAEMNANGTFVMLAEGLTMVGVNIESSRSGGVTLSPEGGFWPRPRYPIAGFDGDLLLAPSLQCYPKLYALGMWNEFDLYAIQHKDGTLDINARYGPALEEAHVLKPAIFGSGLHTTSLRAEPYFQQAIDRLSMVGLRLMPPTRPINWVPRTSMLFH